MHICFAMIDRSDMVIQLDGWQQSEGATLEASYAESKGITVMEACDLWR
jgi:hypothetical protein